MLGILWWLCKLGLLITFGIPFILLGFYALIIIIFTIGHIILEILEK